LNEFKCFARNQHLGGTVQGVMNPRALVVAALALALVQCRQPPQEDRRPAPPKREPSTAAAQHKAKPPVIDPKPATTPPREGEPIYHVGGAVSRPQLIHRIDLDDDRLSHLRPAGALILAAVISKRGTIENARMLKPADPEVEAMLLGAVRQWRFRPAMKDGKPVSVYYTLTLNIDWQ